MKLTEKDYKGSDAIVFYGTRITYGKLIEYIDRFAAGLKLRNVRAGDTVTLCMPNSPAAAIAFYAINKIGAKVNLLHPYSSSEEMRASMSETGSSLLIAYELYLYKNRSNLPITPIIVSENDEFMPFIPKLVYRWKNRGKRKFRGGEKFLKIIRKSPADRSAPYMFGENETAVYLASGGTTGKSKIIKHNCRVFNELAGKAMDFVSEPRENYKAIYSVLPIFHGFGLCMNMHLAAIMGLTNVMTLKFDPVSMSKAIEKEKVSLLTGVPTMFSRLLACKRFLNADLSSLKECFVGGDKAPQSLLDKFNAALKSGGSKGRLFVGYGLTETVTVCCVTNFEHYKEGSIGYPIGGCRLAVTDGEKLLSSGEEGEILIDTPIMMLGYLGEEESPIKEIGGEKWLFTGDWGYLDSDGFLFFKQRIKNIIKVNGVPVFPVDVEAALEKAEGVKRVAVFGVDDEKRGQSVKAFIEPYPDADREKLETEIKKICEEKLNVYSRPKEIEYRDVLPTNAIGKIDIMKLK